eukprot:ANDGO_08304.mRNA.1 Myosin heavy chain kinase A
MKPAASGQTSRSRAPSNAGVASPASLAVPGVISRPRAPSSAIKPSGSGFATPSTPLRSQFPISSSLRVPDASPSPPKSVPPSGLKIMGAPLAGVRCMAVVGDQIWCGGRSGKIAVFDAKRLSLMTSLQSPLKEAVTSICGMGDRVWVGYSTGAVEVWRDMRYERQAYSCSTSMAAGVLEMMVVAKSQIWVASQDFTVRIFDYSTGDPIAVISAHENWVEALCEVAPLEQVWTGSADRTIRMWKIKDFSSVGQLEGHTRAVTAIAFRGKYAWSGDESGSIRAWSISTRSCVLVIPSGQFSGIARIVSTPSSLWTCGVGKHIMIFDAETKRGIRALETKSSKYVSSMVMHGRYMWTGSTDVRVFDVGEEWTEELQIEEALEIQQAVEAAEKEPASQETEMVEPVVLLEPTMVADITAASDFGDEDRNSGEGDNENPPVVDDEGTPVESSDVDVDELLNANSDELTVQIPDSPKTTFLRQQSLRHLLGPHYAVSTQTVKTCAGECDNWTQAAIVNAASAVQTEPANVRFACEQTDTVLSAVASEQTDVLQCSSSECQVSTVMLDCTAQSDSNVFLSISTCTDDLGTVASKGFQMSSEFSHSLSQSELTHNDIQKFQDRIVAFETAEHNRIFSEASRLDDETSKRPSLCESISQTDSVMTPAVLHYTSEVFVDIPSSSLMTMQASTQVSPDSISSSLQTDSVETYSVQVFTETADVVSISSQTLADRCSTISQSDLSAKDIFAIESESEQRRCETERILAILNRPTPERASRLVQASLQRDLSVVALPTHIIDTHREVSHVASSTFNEVRDSASQNDPKISVSRDVLTERTVSVSCAVQSTAETLSAFVQSTLSSSEIDVYAAEFARIQALSLVDRECQAEMKPQSVDAYTHVDDCLLVLPAAVVPTTMSSSAVMTEVLQCMNAGCQMSPDVLPVSSQSDVHGITVDCALAFKAQWDAVRNGCRSITSQTRSRVLSAISNDVISVLSTSRSSVSCQESADHRVSFSQTDTKPMLSQSVWTLPPSATDSAVQHIWPATCEYTTQTDGPMEPDEIVAQQVVAEESGNSVRSHKQSPTRDAETSIRTLLADAGTVMPACNLTEREVSAVASNLSAGTQKDDVQTHSVWTTMDHEIRGCCSSASQSFFEEDSIPTQTPAVVQLDVGTYSETLHHHHGATQTVSHVVADVGVSTSVLVLDAGTLAHEPLTSSCTQHDAALFVRDAFCVTEPVRMLPFTEVFGVGIQAEPRQHSDASTDVPRCLVFDVSSQNEVFFKSQSTGSDSQGMEIPAPIVAPHFPENSMVSIASVSCSTDLCGISDMANLLNLRVVPGVTCTDVSTEPIPSSSACQGLQTEPSLFSFDVCIGAAPSLTAAEVQTAALPLTSHLSTQSEHPILVDGAVSAVVPTHTSSSMTDLVSASHIGTSPACVFQIEVASATDCAKQNAASTDTQTERLQWNVSWRILLVSQDCQTDSLDDDDAISEVFSEAVETVHGEHSAHPRFVDGPIRESSRACESFSQTDASVFHLRTQGVQSERNVESRSCQHAFDVVGLHVFEKECMCCPVLESVAIECPSAETFPISAQTMSFGADMGSSTDPLSRSSWSSLCRISYQEMGVQASEVLKAVRAVEQSTEMLAIPHRCVAEYGYQTDLAPSGREQCCWTELCVASDASSNTLERDKRDQHCSTEDLCMFDGSLSAALVSLKEDVNQQTCRISTSLESISSTLSAQMASLREELAKREREFLNQFEGHASLLGSRSAPSDAETDTIRVHIFANLDSDALSVSLFSRDADYVCSYLSSTVNFQAERLASLSKNMSTSLQEWNLNRNFPLADRSAANSSLLLLSEVQLLFSSQKESVAELDRLVRNVTQSQTRSASSQHEEVIDALNSLSSDIRAVQSSVAAVSTRTAVFKDVELQTSARDFSSSDTPDLKITVVDDGLAISDAQFASHTAMPMTEDSSSVSLKESLSRIEALLSQHVALSNAISSPEESKHGTSQYATSNNFNPFGDDHESTPVGPASREPADSCLSEAQFEEVKLSMQEILQTSFQDLLEHQAFSSFSDTQAERVQRSVEATLLSERFRALVAGREEESPSLLRVCSLGTMVEPLDVSSLGRFAPAEAQTDATVCIVDSAQWEATHAQLVEMQSSKTVLEHQVQMLRQQLESVQSEKVFLEGLIDGRMQYVLKTHESLELVLAKLESSTNRAEKPANGSSRLTFDVACDSLPASALHEDDQFTNTPLSSQSAMSEFRAMFSKISEEIAALQRSSRPSTTYADDQCTRKEPEPSLLLSSGFLTGFVAPSTPVHVSHSLDFVPLSDEMEASTMRMITRILDRADWIRLSLNSADLRRVMPFATSHDDAVVKSREILAEGVEKSTEFLSDVEKFCVQYGKQPSPWTGSCFRMARLLREVCSLKLTLLDLTWQINKIAEEKDSKFRSLLHKASSKKKVLASDDADDIRFMWEFHRGKP